MKRIGVVLALVAPAVGLGLWALFPQADPSLAAPLFHFYIVTFTTFAATVVSLFVTISVGQTALPRHLLLALAFAWMGAVFLIHGATTPGALIAYIHPAITWSAWLTLFGGGGIFLIAAFAPNQPNPRFLRVVALSIAIIYLVYVAAVILLPGLLGALLNLSISPTLADIAFVLTLIIWLVAGVKLYRNFQVTRNFVDGLMAFEAGWYIGRHREHVPLHAVAGGLVAVSRAAVAGFPDCHLRPVARLRAAGRLSVEHGGVAHFCHPRTSVDSVAR